MRLSKTDQTLLAASPRYGIPYLLAAGGWRIANSIQKLSRAGLIQVESYHVDSSAPPLGFRRAFYCECRYQVVDHRETER
jgi:hypothetical protein